MDNKSFEQYKSLKRKFNLIKNGIHFNHVLAPQFVQLSYKENDFNNITFRSIIRPLYKTLCFDPLLESFSKNNLAITTYVERKDYDNLITSYLGDNKQVSLIRLHNLPQKNVLNIINIFTAVRYILPCYNLSFKKKTYLITHLIHYFNLLSSLEKLFKNVDLSNKKYIAFNSAYELETLLVQYFEQKKAHTFHLSHGLSYIKYNNYIPYDAINGENITAETILVWGESSKKDLMINYNKKALDIIVAGNPQYKFKYINAKTTFKKGVVFLGRPIYDNDNVDLLKLIKSIAKIYAITFTIKVHPLSNMNLFTSFETEDDNLSFAPKTKTINDLLSLNEYDFAIAYNTTSYYEAMYYNMICFRYSINENECYKGLDDKFYDEKSFELKLQRFKKMNTTILNKDIQNTLIENIGMGINNYNIF